MNETMREQLPLLLVDHDRYLPFLVISTAGALYRGASRSYQGRFGIGMTEWRLLSALAAQPNSTANQLCKITFLDKAAASRSLQVLQRGGYVTIGMHTEDARKKSVNLTPAGFELYKKLLDVALRRLEHIVAGFSAEETAILTGLLQRLRTNIIRTDKLE